MSYPLPASDQVTSEQSTTTTQSAASVQIDHHSSLNPLPAQDRPVLQEQPTTAQSTSSCQGFFARSVYEVLREASVKPGISNQQSIPVQTGHN